MTGADRLVARLGELGVSHVFTNPGTTELELVRALTTCESVTPVLVAQELVATAAADGFGRIRGVGAALLHLGPGFSNGAAFVHDARRAHTPMLVIVGEHPAPHLELDAPLNTDLAAIMEPFCVAVVVIDDVATIDACLDAAMRSAHSLGGPVGVIAPQDVMAAEVPPSSWVTPVVSHAVGITARSRPMALAHPYDVITPHVATVDVTDIDQKILGDDPLFIVGSTALLGAGPAQIVAIATKVKARCVAEVFPAVMERGTGIPYLPRLPYFPDQARAVIGTPSAVVFVGAGEPLAYFAEEGRSGYLIDQGVPRTQVVAIGGDAETILGQWCRHLGLKDLGEVRGVLDTEAANELAEAPPSSLAGDDEVLTIERLGEVFAAAICEGDVIVDEGRTSSAPAFLHARKAPPHRYLAHPGGAIGGGLGLALGAALASGARVRALVADGGSLYAPQALWTMARCNLPIGVVIVANDGYRILRIEMRARGIEPVSDELTRLGGPAIDYVALAHAFGVNGYRARTVHELTAVLSDRRNAVTPFLVVAELDQN